MSEESVALSYRQGGSDKVYNASLIKEPTGYVVNFAYGRRNGTLNIGTKTAKPIPYEQAKKAYDKLVNAKIAKGYTADGSGTPFRGSTMAPDRTNWLPQLLNPIERENVPEAYLRFLGHVAMQTKHDGERRAIFYRDGEVYGANRRGLKVSLHPAVEKDVITVAEGHNLTNMILDAEDMGDYIIVFDVIEWDADLRDQPFKLRAEKLKLIADMSSSAVGVDTPHFYHSIENVMDYIFICEQNNEEGVVLRNPTASYTEGRPNSWGDCLKLKFYASATCEVGSIHPDKRSIGLVVLDNSGDSVVEVGNCTIPPNYKIPEVGQLVEIKYLYAYRGGSLYQPQYKGVRSDLEYPDKLDKLKYKE